jgi:hypothetical protein
MLKKFMNSFFQPGRIGRFFVLSSVLVFATACAGAAATPANPAGTTGNNASTSAPVDVPTQLPTVASPSATKADACTYLTQDDVSKALGITAAAGVSSGLGGVCMFTTTDLKVELTVTILAVPSTWPIPWRVSVISPWLSLVWAIRLSLIPTLLLMHYCYAKATLHLSSVYLI